MTADAGGADREAIEMIEDRLLSRLRDASLAHEDPAIWLFKSVFGAGGPCSVGCALCALMPHIRAALTEAANVGRVAVGRRGAIGPGHRVPGAVLGPHTADGCDLRMERADIRACLAELVEVLRAARGAGSTVSQALKSCGRPLPERAALFLAVMAAAALERAELTADQAAAVAFQVVGADDGVALRIEVVPREGRPGDN